jgi:hypothetical protein
MCNRVIVMVVAMDCAGIMMKLMRRYGDRH